MTIAQIENIVKKWTIEGNHNHPEDGKLPLHPEFIYRTCDQWKGWNDFLQTAADSPHYQEHLERDELENKAWSLYKKKLN